MAASAALFGILKGLAAVGLVVPGVAYAVDKYGGPCDGGAPAAVDALGKVKCSLPGGEKPGNDCAARAEALLRAFTEKHGANTTAWSEETLQAYVALKEQAQRLRDSCGKETPKDACFEKGRRLMEDFFRTHGKDRGNWTDEDRKAYATLQREMEALRKACAPTTDDGDPCRAKAEALVADFRKRFGDGGIEKPEAKKAYERLHQELERLAKECRAPEPRPVARPVFPTEPRPVPVDDGCRAKADQLLADFVERNGRDVTKWSDDTLRQYVHLRAEVHHLIAQCNGPRPVPCHHGHGPFGGDPDGREGDGAPMVAGGGMGWPAGDAQGWQRP